MSLLVALPDDGMRDRIAARLADAGIDAQPGGAAPAVELAVWRAGDAPLDRMIDLLVTPYVVDYAQLEKLGGEARFVQGQSLGFDGVASHLPAGLAFSNAVGVHEAPTAELALALMLASQRGWPEIGRQQVEGRWHRDIFPGLIGSRVLLIGVGGIGGELLKRIDGFGAEVTKVAHTARGDIHSIDELPELLPKADIVVLALPLSEETRGLVDGAFLDRLPHGALVVNVSRGPIVDTDALVERVRTGAIRSALDVFDPEPLPDGHPLWSLPGSLVSPHLGGNVASMKDRIDPVVVSQIERMLRGLEPDHIVLDTRTTK